MNDFFSHRSRIAEGFLPKFSLLIVAVFTLIVTVIAGIITTSTAAYSAAPTVAVQQWSTTTALPQAVAERNGVVHQGRLYFVGGKTTSNTPSAEVYVAQIAADGSLSSWSTTTRLLVPVYLHAVAASETHLYVIGGWDGNRTRSEIWQAAFDAGGGLGPWSKVNDYPSTIDLHDAAIVGNRLYVAGGWTGTNPLDTVYYADIQGNGLGAWQAVASLPKKLFRLSLATYNGVLYVTGGYDNNTAVNTVYYAQVQANGALNSWQPSTNLPDSRYYHDSVIHDGRLLILGGKSDSTEYNSIFAAPIGTNGTLGVWSAEPALPESLHRLAAVSVSLNGSDFVYVLGGLHGSGYRSTVYHSAVPPPPTSGPTPTAIPLPSPTPTPPPLAGVEISLSNQPQGWVAPGEEITYRVDYRNIGTESLAEVFIANTIPANVEVIPTSLTAGSTGVVTLTQSSEGDAVLWSLGTLGPNQSGSVSYRVRRPTGLGGVPFALSITKSGPAAVTSSQPITYHLTVTNNVPITLTNLVITDVLPAAATYVGGGDGPPDNGVIRWTIPQLTGDSATSVEYVVTSAQSLINSDYRVTTAEGPTVRGKVVVITLVDNTPLPPKGDGFAVVNPNAIASWQHNGQASNRESNSVFNPAFPLFLPVIAR